MPEGFSVKPHWVSGYGNAIGSEASNLSEIGTYISNLSDPSHSWLQEHFTGLLSVMTKPMQMYANSAKNRFAHTEWVASHSATELRRVAWEYLAIEEGNTELFDENVKMDQGELEVELDEGAEYYPVAEPELPVREVTGTLELLAGGTFGPFCDLWYMFRGLDWFFVEALGWSPLTELIEELIGSWDALARAGEALIAAGDAAEVVATSMKEGLTTLDLHWDGGAAQACASYVTRLYEAVSEEGPLNRTVGKVYELIAAKVIETLDTFAAELDIPTKNILDALGGATNLFCYGEVPTESMIKKAREILNESRYPFDWAAGTVGAIKDAIDTANEFIEIMSDPIGAGENLDVTIPGTEAKLKESIQKVPGGIATAKDLVDLADLSELSDVPGEGFEVGEDSERDGD